MAASHDNAQYLGNREDPLGVVVDTPGLLTKFSLRVTEVTCNACSSYGDHYNATNHCVQRFPIKR